jgi:Cu+-exporting ATPase
MVGTGMAARFGILIKDAEALEQAHRVTTVVLDKTGTLTEGRPAVLETVALNGLELELVQLAGSAQQGSEHPLARSILDYAKGSGIELSPVSDFTSRPGRGLSATVLGRQLVIGNRRLMHEEAIGTDPMEEQAAEFEGQGGTVMWIAAKTPKTELLGIIAVGDELKEGAGDALQALRNSGIETVMLTGDNQRTAAFVAGQLAIDQVTAEVLPEDKATEIERLRDAGHVVAMVGDGINDAPALAAADIGLAMGTGTDVAMHTAGITLMRGDPRLIADAIGISRATHSKIRQNLFWAFVYNIIAIPLAASGHLSPVVAGAAMALSSVSVVSNSLLLRRWRPRGAQS